VTVRVKELHGDVVFLHEVAPGAADRSYGIAVAKLAGLPTKVIERAKVVLAKLEAEDRTGPTRALIDDLPLFAARPPPSPTPSPPLREEVSDLLERLAALNPDEMSPREALEALYTLKLEAGKTRQ
jgi:DNA mismatch repair protein MutS